jgi:hypothetical protein
MSATNETIDAGQQASQDWWRTEIIDMKPGEIRYRGYPIEQLIGNVSFAQMIWLMLRGELPGKREGELLDAALMAAVDHGPQAPSIAIARMAATCGVGLNNAMASAVNVLGDVHGGAGEQAVELYQDIARRFDAGTPFDDAVAAGLAHYRDLHGKFVSASAIDSIRSTARAAPAGAGGSGCRRWRGVRPLRSDCARGGEGARRGTRQADPDEHRRRDRCHLRGTGISCAAGTRAILPVALGGHPVSCVGANPAGRPQQGADSAPVHLDVRRAAATGCAGGWRGGIRSA